jgi:hypothetical protein
MPRRPVRLAAVVLSALPLAAQRAVEVAVVEPANLPVRTVAPERDTTAFAPHPGVIAGVEHGLAWLAAEQSENGFWFGLVGQKRGDGYLRVRSVDAQRLDGTGHLGVTGLCGMAFLAGGHVPGRGRYGDVVGRAVDAVLSCVHESG